jgi:hypothetical protein
MSVKRKRVIVHAGYHKTGSTSIQVALTNAREELRAAGILYPLSGVPEAFPYGHHLLAWSLRDRPQAAHFIDADARQELWRSVCDEIEASSASVVIFSSEEFDRLSFEEINLLARRLTEYQITPVIFLRNHADLIESMYRTYVIHMGYSSSIARFAVEESPRLDFANMLRDWAAIASQDAVVLSYEDESIRSDSVATFLGAIDVGDYLPAENRSIRVNDSVPAFVVETARYLQQQAFEEGQMRRWISDVRRIAFGTTCARFSCMPDWLRNDLDQRFRIEAAAIVSDVSLKGCLRGTLDMRPLPYRRVVITNPLQAMCELGYRCEPTVPPRAFSADDVRCIGAVDEMTGTLAQGWLHGAREGERLHVVLTFDGETALSASVDPQSHRFVLDLGSRTFRYVALRAMARRRDNAKYPTGAAPRLAQEFGIAVEAVFETAGAPFQARFVLPFPIDFPAERTAREWLRFLNAAAGDFSPLRADEP